MLFPSSDLSHSFAPQSDVPVIADLNFSGSSAGVAMILNQAQIGFMDEFGGGGENNNFQSGRFTAKVYPIFKVGNIRYNLLLLVWMVKF